MEELSPAKAQKYLKYFLFFELSNIVFSLAFHSHVLCLASTLLDLKLLVHLLSCVNVGKPG